MSEPEPRPEHEPRELGAIEVPLPSPLRRFLRTAQGRVLLAVVVILVLGGVLRLVNVGGSLRYLHVKVTSGAEQGNYYALVGSLADEARKHKGRIENLPSVGSVENVARLAAEGCSAHFGLAQAGTPIPASVSVVGRLPKSESVFFLGKGADGVRAWKDLEKKRIGIGPEGSGTAHLVRTLFAMDDLAPLGVTLEAHPIDEQLELVAKGQLDLAVLVIDEDAALLKDALRTRGLSIASLPNMDALARRLSGMRTGRIGAGQYDAVRTLPPEDKRVLRVDTLVLAAPCASRSDVVGMLLVLDDAFPDFVRVNRETPPPGDLELAPAAKEFFVNQGPDALDRYVPWLADVMPLGAWVYLVMGVSVLFNGMGVLHRFRVWRIDAARLQAEEDLVKLFWRNVTPHDIEGCELEPRMLEEDHVRRTRALLRDLEALAVRVREQSLSMVAPMGQEMVYRYQEDLVVETIAALRTFRGRVEDALAARGAS